MRKFLAVVKREYKKVVFTWAFLIGTLVAPLIASMFAVVPMIIFSIKGDVQRIAAFPETPDGGKAKDEFVLRFVKPR